MSRVYNPEQGIYELDSDDSFIAVLSFRLRTLWRRVSGMFRQLFDSPPA